MAIVEPLHLHVGIIDGRERGLEVGRLPLHQGGVLQGPSEHGPLELRGPLSLRAGPRRLQMGDLLQSCRVLGLLDQRRTG